jgi:glycosyltransferase involved in cell wall biosynthesis
MNIIHIPRRFVRSHWGGTETVILETCNRLIERGHKTSIMCPNALAPESEESIGGIKVRRFPYFYPYLGLSADSRSLLDRKGGNIFSFSLMRALKQEPDLDIIHLHTGKRIGGIARHVAKKRGIPYVISLHGGKLDVPASEAATWTEPTRRSLEWGKLLGWWVGSRRVIEDASAIICVGLEESVRTQTRYPRKRVVYLPNGVDVGHFRTGDRTGFRRKYHIPDNAYVILTVGRIDPQKNQILPIKILPELQSIEPNVHQLIVGPSTNDEYYDSLVCAIKEKGLENKITLIPGLPNDSKDLVDAFHSADLFLLPSVHEPFGIVILEAWAANLPVLASRVGGVPAFVRDGQDGLLFDCSRPESLIRAFEYAMKHPQDMKRMAAEGLAKAQKDFSWDAISDRLINIYLEVLSEGPLCK